ncbi:hypothetical protein L208DRAFT_1515251 [Tricholoma matsutake]|nr:hypothetical protein L208DRAFT_1515251 [Tricholoma matsutake 945]
MISKVILHNALVLKLHQSFKTDQEINISCLCPYHPPTIPGQQTTPQPLIIVEGAPEYIVEEILDSYLRQNKLEFLIKWKNYTDKNNSWRIVSKRVMQSPNSLNVIQMLCIALQEWCMRG